jgi:predicted HicB family RNase H-like nuclease
MTKIQIDFDPSEFGITIRKRNIEGQWYFAGTVSELPDVEVYEDTYEDAYQEILNVISNLKLMSNEKQRFFPAPQIPTEEYSGRVTLRLTKSLHKRSAQIAGQEGVSLNQLLITLIAEGIGAKCASSPNEQRRVDVLGASSEHSAQITKHSNVSYLSPPRSQDDLTEIKAM